MMLELPIAAFQPLLFPSCSHTEQHTLLRSSIAKMRA